MTTQSPPTASLVFLLLAVSLLALALGSNSQVEPSCGEKSNDHGGDGECTVKEYGVDTKTTTTIYVETDPFLTDLLSRIHTHEFFINGSWVLPVSMNDSTSSGHPSTTSQQQLKDVVDPSTAKAFTRIALGNADDTDRAVRAAHAAYPGWSLHTTPRQRKAFVQGILDGYRTRQEDMAYLISREMGSPIDMARSSQVGAGLYHMEAALQIFDDFRFIRKLPSSKQEEDEEEEEGNGSGTTILMDPIGVVAAITPWNWPLNQITIKVIPALLVGCTVVLKPSEMTPLSALVFADIVREAGLPPGVFNLVNGLGPVVGQQLSSHPFVDMVSFTGSTRAGVLVSKAAADTFKKVTLELGGKGANLVFDDVGDDWADEILADATDRFYNSGQSCDYASRLLVHRSLYDKTIQATKLSALETRVDSAHLPGRHHIGPVASQAQYERVQYFIQSGLDQGATLVAGGLGKPSHLQDSPGAYVRPTVFADCTRDMEIFQQEIFGPVLCITPFDTEEEAVELANATPYGLSNYAYTRNGPRRRRLAHALKSGQVSMNDQGGELGTPFGGVRASGIGREGGMYGMEEFCEIKAVTGYHNGPHDIVVGTEAELEEEQQLR
ncbi:hypothetical protein ACA910_018315 [Epithemia clementina (nom. ined.)]